MRLSKMLGAVAASQPLLTAASGGKIMTVRQALYTALVEEFAREKSLLLIGEEVDRYQGAFKVTLNLGSLYPGRVIDTPISEYGFSGLAAGAAMMGTRMVVEYMSFNFALQALDAIFNTTAKMRYMSAGKISVPVVFRGGNSISLGAGAQHSQCLASFMAAVPGLIVAAPFDATDARGLLKSAIRTNNPVLFLEHELLYSFEAAVTEDVLSPEFTIPFGKAHVARQGRDVTIATYSRGVKLALQAAEALARENVSVEVLNLRSLRPLDTESIIRSVSKTGRLVTVDDAYPYCNMGAELIATVATEAFSKLVAPPERVACADVPLPYSLKLEQMAIPKKEDVISVVRRAMRK